MHKIKKFLRISPRAVRLLFIAWNIGIILVTIFVSVRYVCVLPWRKAVIGTVCLFLANSIVGNIGFGAVLLLLSFLLHLMKADKE